MDYDATSVDVLCVGQASYDLVFGVDHHPADDEKCIASSHFSCGGGPAANAAVTVARLGLKSAFIGFTSTDVFGEKQRQELLIENVNTEYIAIGDKPSPTSSIYVKPNGNRTVVNFKDKTNYLPSEFVHDVNLVPRVLLFDGHEPHISTELIRIMKFMKVPSLLDAGSVNEGTKHLLDKVNYIIASEKFARDFTGYNDERALDDLSNHAPNVIITRGNNNVIWKNVNGTGQMAPFAINAIDTTGAGDVFHGAFAYGLALRRPWSERIKFAMAAAALSCTKMGARPGIPTLSEVESFLNTA